MLFTTHPDMVNTKEYDDLRNNVIRHYIKAVKKGKVKVLKSDYRWLLSNPIEMLWYSTRQCQKVDRADVPHPLVGWQVHISNYEDGQELAAFRNPHLSSGNVCHFTNKHSDDISAYIHLTDNIAVVNSIGIDLMPRMSGCDFDSDQANFVPNTTIVKLAKRCMEECPTPICDIHAKANDEKPTPENLAKIDNLISRNKIGKMCNRAQEFMSYWNDRANNLLDRKELQRRRDDGEKLTEDEIAILGNGVTEANEQECKHFMDEYYRIISAFSSLTQVEIDMPKKYINITDVYNRFIEEISDWKTLGLYEPVIGYSPIREYGDEHEAILAKYGIVKGKAEDEKRFNDI
jgi:hypothetical protein